MTIAQLRSKHARALRELAKSYAQRRKAIIAAQRSQLRERLRHKNPNDWRAASKTRALVYSTRWHNLLSKPLVSKNKKI